MTYSRPSHDYGHAEELEVLCSLRQSLEARVEAGDPHALLHLQVVVAFIAELEEPQAAALEV